MIVFFLLPRSTRSRIRHPLMFASIPNRSGIDGFSLSGVQNGHYSRWARCARSNPLFGSKTYRNGPLITLWDVLSCP
jgi:hypothetical protein